MKAGKAFLSNGTGKIIPGAPSSRQALAAGLLLALVLQASCREIGESSIDILAPEERAVSFSADVQPILSRSCAAVCGCHAGPPPEDCSPLIPGAVFEEGEAYGNLVNVPAFENPALDRIEPCDPSRPVEECDLSKSYLYLKISTCDSGIDPGEFDPCDAPGCIGECMPQKSGRSSPLSEGDISILRQWIQQGAENN